MFAIAAQRFISILVTVQIVLTGVLGSRVVCLCEQICVPIAAGGSSQTDPDDCCHETDATSIAVESDPACCTDQCLDLMFEPTPRITSKPLTIQTLATVPVAIAPTPQRVVEFVSAMRRVGESILRPPDAIAHWRTVRLVV